MNHCLLLLIRRDLPLRGLHRDEFVAFYFHPLAACPSLAYLWLVCWVQLLFAHRYLVRESSDHLQLLQSLSESPALLLLAARQTMSPQVQGCKVIMKFTLAFFSLVFAGVQCVFVFTGEKLQCLQVFWVLAARCLLISASRHFLCKRCSCGGVNAEL